jgi:hypothetical protein
VGVVAPSSRQPRGVVAIRRAELSARCSRAVVALTLVGVVTNTTIVLLPIYYGPRGYHTVWSNLPGTYGYISALATLASLLVPMVAMWFAVRGHRLAGGGALVALAASALIRLLNYIFFEVGLAKAYGAPENGLPGTPRVFLSSAVNLLALSAVALAGIVALRGGAGRLPAVEDGHSPGTLAVPLPDPPTPGPSGSVETSSS